MKHQVLGAKSQRALNLTAKGFNTLPADIVSLAAHVDKVAGMDDERADVVLGAQCTHALALLRIDLGGVPHARAGRKNLECVSADLPRAEYRVGCATRGANVDPDAFRHFASLVVIVRL